MTPRRLPIFLGLGLVTIGVLFLLRELGAVPDISFWTFFWLGLGAWLLIGTLAGNRRGWFWPVTLVAVGFTMLLRDIDVLDADFAIWPVVIIAIGASVVLQGWSLSRRSPRTDILPRD